MAVTITRNFGDLRAIKLVNRDVMRELGLLARERILRRTRAGISSDESPFAAYSPAYAALKQKELGTSQVNLTVSGRMLNDIDLVAIGDTFVELGFKS